MRALVNATGLVSACSMQSRVLSSSRGRLSATLSRDIFGGSVSRRATAACSGVRSVEEEVTCLEELCFEFFFDTKLLKELHLRGLGA
jgi:hypothetical protein